MTVAQAYRMGVDALTQANVSDARVNAGWLLSALTGEQRLMLALLTRELPPDTLARYEAMLARMQAGEPLQYVLGTQEFMGQTFRVDRRVLIPREDTATLVHCTLEHIGDTPARVLDMGTGSGAIAITVKTRCRAAQVTAVDVSEAALSVARENARALGAQVRFVKSDLFDALAGERFDVIVSNPPYIPAGEIPALQREVQSEPCLALDGGADGLHFYRAMTSCAGEYLEPGGMLLFEVGHDQAKVVLSLMQGNGFVRTGTKKDLNGIERVVYGEINASK